MSLPSKQQSRIYRFQKYPGTLLLTGKKTNIFKFLIL